MIPNIWDCVQIHGGDISGFACFYIPCSDRVTVRETEQCSERCGEICVVVDAHLGRGGYHRGNHWQHLQSQKQIRFIDFIVQYEVLQFCDCYMHL